MRMQLGCNSGWMRLNGRREASSGLGCIIIQVGNTYFILRGHFRHRHLCAYHLIFARYSVCLRRIHLSLNSTQYPSRIPGHDVKGGHILYHDEPHISQNNTVVPRALTLVTTLPAPTVHPFPILTPGRMVAFPPIQQSSPTQIGLPNSGPLSPFRVWGSSGCPPL